MDWKTSIAGGLIGTILTLVVLNVMPSAAPYVVKPKPVG